MVYRSPRPPSELAADAVEFREPAFREALAAGLALVIHANGAPSASARGRLLCLLDEEAALASVSPAALREALDAQEANFHFDPEVGTLMAREALERIAGRVRLAAALVRICRALIPSDGRIRRAEHLALAEIRSALGVTERAPAFRPSEPGPVRPRTAAE